MAANREEFQYLFTDQPHIDRRLQILKKHPDVRKLMGHDHATTAIVTAEVLAQFLIAYILRDSPWSSIFIVAYCLGGTINHSLSLSFHEIGHNLAAGNGRPYVNRWIGFFGNLPIGLPSSISFKKYHNDHHKFLGDYQFDPDIPHELEAWAFNHRIGRFIWLLLQPLTYSIRPFIRNPTPPIYWEYVNALVQICFDGIWIYFFGLKSFLYFILSSLLGLGLNPLGGHFISEHYMFVKNYETYSYYGPLNVLTFNVGYHNEHHDFPNIPWTKLPALKKLAPEYYDSMPMHQSCKK